MPTSPHRHPSPLGFKSYLSLEDHLTCHKPLTILVENAVSYQSGRPSSCVSVFPVTLITPSLVDL